MPVTIPVADDDQKAPGSAGDLRANGSRGGLRSLLGDGVPRVSSYLDAETGDLQTAYCQAARRSDSLSRTIERRAARYEEASLREYGLDYYVVGGRAFFSQQEVFDVVNLASISRRR